MEESKFKIILASGSPRRKDLLESTFLPFEVVPSNIEEISSHENVENLVMDLATQKAQDVFRSLKDDHKNLFVIGSDTVVVRDGKVLGKPANTEEASQMLLSLSGRSHFVYTAVSFVTKTQVSSFFEKTQVWFEEISDDLLSHYLNTGESMDKAGGYGIQKHALSFVKKIEGSYSSVVGLPINRLLIEMKEFLNIPKNKQDWRDLFE